MVPFVGGFSRELLEPQAAHGYLDEQMQAQSQDEFPGTSKGHRVEPSAFLGAAANQGSCTHKD